jgi:hypothetical protein
VTRTIDPRYIRKLAERLRKAQEEGNVKKIRVVGILLELAALYADPSPDENLGYDPNQPMLDQLKRYDLMRDDLSIPLCNTMLILLAGRMNLLIPKRLDYLRWLCKFGFVTFDEADNPSLTVLGRQIATDIVNLGRTKRLDTIRTFGVEEVLINYNNNEKKLIKQMFENGPCIFKSGWEGAKKRYWAAGVSRPQWASLHRLVDLGDLEMQELPFESWPGAYEYAQGKFWLSTTLKQRIEDAGGPNPYFRAMKKRIEELEASGFVLDDDPIW